MLSAQRRKASSSCDCRGMGDAVRTGMLSWTQSANNQCSTTSVVRKSWHKPDRPWHGRSPNFIGCDDVQPQQNVLQGISLGFLQGLCNCQGAFLRSSLHRWAACIASSLTRSDLGIVAEMFGSGHDLARLFPIGVWVLLVLPNSFGAMS